MGCDKPLTAYFSAEVNPATGKRPMVFDIRRAHSPTPVKLPCQQCMGCRLEHSRQWAMRGMHESKMHSFNEFLTLIYDDDHLPEGGTLVREHPQLFLKRLRKKFVVSEETRIRFFGCGEYGEKTLRPHYHFILFNYHCPDKKFYKMAKNGVDKYYTSEVMRELWPMGFNVLGDVTFKSVAYVARYVTGKYKGDGAEAHYQGRLPEFPMYSRDGGIGLSWFQKYGEHAYQWDSVIVNGQECQPPRYYDTKYELLDKDRLALLKLQRRRKVDRKDNSAARRHTKEEVLRLNLKVIGKVM